MPDVNGKLTPSDVQTINTWFAIRNPKCPVDNTTSWNFVQHVLYTPSFASTQEGAAPGNAVYGHVVLVCATCSYEMWLYAEQLGIVTYGGSANV